MLLIDVVLLGIALLLVIATLVKYPPPSPALAIALLLVIIDLIIHLVPKG